MRLRRSTTTIALLLVATSACGGNGGTEPARATGSSTGSTAAATASVTPGRTTDILGDKTLFTGTTNGAGDVAATVNKRQCTVKDAPLVDCHAATGTGGQFVVTAEGNNAVPTEWNVVVRCGLDPAVPVASARGTFTPQFTELGSSAYGEMIGITFNGEQDGDANLAFLPPGTSCPVVWGLGRMKRFSSFTGGLDPLNGSERPLQFTRPDGTTACVVADTKGDLDVHAASQDGCTAA
jgi:hypothetical protein